MQNLAKKEPVLKEYSMIPICIDYKHITICFVNVNTKYVIKFKKIEIANIKCNINGYILSGR